MSDVIIIVNFSRAYRCIVGVNHDERFNKQTLIVEVILALEKCTNSAHEIEDCLDQLIDDALHKEQAFLLERLVLRLARLIEERWNTARYLHVVLKKPEAILSATHAFVSLIMKDD